MKFWATWPAWQRGALLGASLVIVVAVFSYLVEPYDDFLNWVRIILWLPALYTLSLLSFTDLPITTPTLSVWFFVNAVSLILYAVGGAAIGWLLQKIRSEPTRNSPLVPSSIPPGSQIIVTIRVLFILLIVLIFVAWVARPTFFWHDVFGGLPMILLVLLPLILARSLKKRLLICLVLLLPLTYLSARLTNIPDTGSLIYLPLMPAMVGLLIVSHFLLQFITEGGGVRFQHLTLLVLAILNGGLIVFIAYQWVNDPFRLRNVAVEHMNVQLCEPIKDSRERDSCIFDIIEGSSNKTACENIIDQYLKDRCYNRPYTR